MLRPNAHLTEVRNGHCVSVPNRTVDTAQAWCSTSDVFGVHVRGSRLDCSSREKQSSFKDLRRRCRIGAFAVLDEVLAVNSLSDGSPTQNGANACCRGGCADRFVDSRQENSGAYWEMTRLYLAATGTTTPTPVHVARIGTTPHRTRTTTSVPASPVSTRNSRSALVTTMRAVHKVWSAGLSSFGEYAYGSGITQSSETSKRVARTNG